jgi:hypothetical protein
MTCSTVCCYRLCRPHKNDLAIQSDVLLHVGDLSIRFCRQCDSSHQFAGTCTCKTTSWYIFARYYNYHEDTMQASRNISATVSKVAAR